MTPNQREAIRRHGQQLLTIFPCATIQDPLKLCRRLRSIQRQIEPVILRDCNRGVPEEIRDREESKTLDALDHVLGWRSAGVPVFVNWDPRGYALKIDDEWIRAQRSEIYRDWGGYGIIAPEIGPRD